MKLAMGRVFGVSMLAVIAALSSACIAVEEDGDPGVEFGTAEDGGEEAVGEASLAITPNAWNAVSAVDLYLRASDSQTGAIIGTMYRCDGVYVMGVDWNTGMAHVNYKGTIGWANKDYLTRSKIEWYAPNYNWCQMN